ncbi:unnamed protein product [Victoria cruziana]
MGKTKSVGFIPFFVMVTSLSFLLSASSPQSNTLYRGSLLPVERPSIDVLISEKGTFKAVFYKVADNDFSFAIWYTETLHPQGTVVWMANRDWPVNSRASNPSFRKRGDLALHDKDGSIVWTTTTNTGSNDAGAAGAVLELRQTGNLVLLDEERRAVWQSFDHPTDTLLPGQPLTRSIRLVSSAGEGNYSSGCYVARFSDDNVLSLIYDGPFTSSVYWPNPDDECLQYNTSRHAILDDMGQFTSSDKLQFFALDFGSRVKRRLTLDFDGILRLYSLSPATKDWKITWMPKLVRCRVHGFVAKMDPADWTQGCKPEFDILCNKTEVKFLKLPQTDFYGYDFNYQEQISIEACQNICRSDCNCRGFGYKLDGFDKCFPKGLLLSGQSGPHSVRDMYLKIPIEKNFGDTLGQYNLDCPKVSSSKKLDRTYSVPKGQEVYLKYSIGFAIAFGVAEMLCKTVHLRNLNQGYVALPMGFRRFTIEELKKATNGFRDEIGRGESGVVFKGILEGKRVAAVKKLEGLSHGSEEQFWSEISTIGRINHMNLVTMFGFCVEKQKRLLVYEYLENGSLEKNLFSNDTMLTSEERFNIAVGTAKALAYLREECLEWVLHCDVKPHNVLLDQDFQPKVADFGLSKLFDRRGNNTSEFSRVRGTRGYMAPDYGILVLELVTGRASTGFHQIGEDGEVGHKQLIPWIREIVRMKHNWVDDIVDPQLSGTYDKSTMEILIKVSLQCVEEERDARPTMSQVVDSIILAGLVDGEAHLEVFWSR